MKNDILLAWNEIEETLTSIRELNDSDLIANRDSLKSRLSIALSLLDKYVSIEDVEKLNN